MATERTLSIIKPDGVKRSLIGKILARFEEAGLRIIGCRLMNLSIEDAQRFYAEHSDRPFFGELTEFMSSGPIVVSVLEGEGAIDLNRELMGATNPADADPGTIRADYSDSVGENTVHGSDSPESARREVEFFFPDLN